MTANDCGDSFCSIVGFERSPIIHPQPIEPPIIGGFFHLKGKGQIH